MMVTLTQIKMMYKPNINRSMTALIIFHSCEDLLSWKWLSSCRRMADRSLASFFSSVRTASSWGMTEGDSVERLWRSREQMTVGASAWCQITWVNNGVRGIFLITYQAYRHFRCFFVGVGEMYANHKSVIWVLLVNLDDNSNLLLCSLSSWDHKWSRTLPA